MLGFVFLFFLFYRYLPYIANLSLLKFLVQKKNLIMKPKILRWKTIIAGCFFVVSANTVVAQQLTSGTATNLVKKNAAELGLSKADLGNMRISNAYVDKISGASLVYVQQTYKGVDVFNSIQTYAFKNEKLVSAAGGRIATIETIANGKSGKAAVTPANAVTAAAAHLQIAASGVLAAKQIDGLQQFDFGKPDFSTINVKSRLLWLPDENLASAILTWQVEIQPKGKPDLWLVNVDAAKGVVISKINLNLSCRWVDPNRIGEMDNIVTAESVEEIESPDGIQAINTAKYKVIPFPIESPGHPGGVATVHNNPWLLAGAGNNATTLKWNSDGTTDWDSSRGNNVLAQEDQNGNNGFGAGAKSSTALPNLTFNSNPNYNQDPTTAANQRFALTNLFYWNNIIHDVTYQYGFDEVSGNFQANNMGRGGNGNDYVFADGQDGSGTNNANFATPSDGSSPRMQMFLWDAVPKTTVRQPAPYRGLKASVESGFSTANKLANVGPVQNRVVLYADDAGNTLHSACTPALNPGQLAGRIALIDRGTCSFTIKVKNAQDAGAIAAIVANNVPGEAPIIMGGTDNSITIPAVMVDLTQGDSMKLVLSLTPNLVVNLAGGVRIDGDLDNSIIAHEYGHGISNRLTGGPNNVGCLQNKEQMGEGWSDYLALMLTTNWATATVADGPLKRGIATYCVGQAPGSAGIRYYPYTTDAGVNPWTYDSLKLSSRFSNGLLTYSPHNVGEVWCNMIWNMTWAIIEETGSINANLYDAAGGGGNNVAFQLVMEGMKLQPCSPGFVSGRNAILKADTLLYGAVHSAAIWQAFASKGLGYSALQGSTNDLKDGTAAYDLPPAPIAKSEPKAIAATAKTLAGIAVSPNPATSNVTVTVGGNKQKLTVDLVSPNGQQLKRVEMNGETLNINLPKLASGIYYLKIAGEGVAETKKLVIQ